MTPCTIEFIELVQIFRLFYSKHFIFVVISIVEINWKQYYGHFVQ